MCAREGQGTRKRGQRKDKGEVMADEKPDTRHWVFLRMASDHIYSNFDHRVVESIKELVAAGAHYGTHTAYDHFGVIWCENGRWFEEVQRFHRIVKVVDAATLEELVQVVNEEFGDE